ncbi:hypothetical protein [Aestuariibacter salexigens]|uniref:hypothetical protein n=1 Tax=Aestuariibacter salexigens TaxID=226010 RepID=UPI000423AF3B|nr:hypothetical protein [Aestuariibacter salexigens]
MKLSKHDISFLNSKLDQQWDSAMTILSGNYLRSVKGRFDNNEQVSLNKGSLRVAHYSNDKLDQRQRNRLSFIEPFGLTRKTDYQKTRKFPVKSLTGARWFYSYNESLTLAFETLHQGLCPGNVIAHITVQLSAKYSAQIKSEARGIRKMTKCMHSMLQKLLGHPVRGFVVLEGSGKRKGQNAPVTAPEAFHAHIVIEANHNMVCMVGKRRDASGKDISKKTLRRFSTTADNAICIQTSTRRVRLKSSPGTLDKANLDSEHGEIDLSLADYLSKSLDEPLVRGSKNFVLWGLTGEVKKLREWKHGVITELTVLRDNIRADLASGVHPGDIEAQFSKVISGRPKPALAA